MERITLPGIMKEVNSFLDVGCCILKLWVSLSFFLNHRDHNTHVC